ncbi:sugar phosphate isomerase/epimerase [Hymenobacter sp.]|uniref:sugar phosphate isomerase/epimerase family protein n=1 Tax=Hymenobacter sp. TaxID=1898978 RepID=UPI00286AB457|nr:sugar phosphate isomerase/epimerase [Hymenobacter sp.]
MNQRRDFLKQAGLLSAMSLLRPGALFAAPAALPLGLQLYTLRDFIGKDVKGVLAKVAKAGYAEVETYGYSREKGFWGLSAKEFKAVLTDVGLTTTSGHYDLSSFVGEGKQEVLQACLEAAATTGQTYVVVPYLPEELRKTRDDFSRIADKLNQLGGLCRAAGLRAAYHSHEFEFKPVDGQTQYKVMLTKTDPALVDFELDVYWAVLAGQDPVKFMAAHPGRFALWHVKDRDKTQPDRTTAVGAGSIDYPKIFQHAQAAGLKRVFMEQEYFAADPYPSITQSAAYIKKKLLS